jgi:hypothetical protein
MCVRITRSYMYVYTRFGFAHSCAVIYASTANLMQRCCEYDVAMMGNAARTGRNGTSMHFCFAVCPRAEEGHRHGGANAQRNSWPTTCPNKGKDPLLPNSLTLRTGLSTPLGPELCSQGVHPLRGQHTLNGACPMSHVHGGTVEVSMSGVHRAVASDLSPMFCQLPLPPPPNCPDSRGLTALPHRHIGPIRYAAPPPRCETVRCSELSPTKRGQLQASRERKGRGV